VIHVFWLVVEIVALVIIVRNQFYIARLRRELKRRDKEPRE